MAMAGFATGCATFCLMMVASCATATAAQAGEDRPSAHQVPFDVNSLAYSGHQSWRWLSIPESRVVLNPYTKVTNGMPPAKDGLALHSGYFVGSSATGQRVSDLLSVGIQTVLPIEQTWWPHMLQMSAMDKVTGMKVQTTDFLADECTILRIIECDASENESGAAIPPIHGGFTGAIAKPVSEILVVDRGDFFTAICLAVTGSRTEQAAGLVPLHANGGNEWSATLPAKQHKRAVVLAAIGFATKAEGADKAVQSAKNVLLKKPAAEWLEERKKAWERLLGAAPHPSNFGVKGVGEISAQTHRQWYYGAWTFLLSQLLPPMPENHYSCYSVAEGKPSLWAEGDPAAPAQCSWTCFMAVGLLAPMMPEKAWSVYEGIMSRVNEEGILLGECLPSRKAQGAWLLYSAAGNRERLKNIYPALKRYLIWREKNPRWIWGTGRQAHDIPDEKDSSFVVSHLIDLDYAVRIASVLGLEKDAAFWREMSAREIENYRNWFFSGDGDPANFYFTEKQTHTFKDRQDQKPCYILSGLGYRGMPTDLVERLQNYYKKICNPAEPLLGFQYLKYGESSFIAYGMQDRGMTPGTDQFLDQCLIATIRPGGDFGEVLEISKGNLVVTGVQPSLFLALQTIDFTLMKNGIRIDRGLR